MTAAIKWRLPIAYARQIFSRRSHTTKALITHPDIQVCKLRPLHHQRVPRRGVSNTIETRHVKQRRDATIFALSTAPGRAAIAVIRISGPACLDIYASLCPSKKPPKPRYAAVRTLYETGGSQTADGILDSSALILYFPAPRTVTGEDVLELHVHGGPAIVKAVLSSISKLGTTYHVRYAEPGEFTRRAFQNNRLDLTQVEALGDTLAATTEQQRRLSVRGTNNGLAKRYDSWRQLLLYARGELEALIDFSEDQHFDESPTELCASVAEQVEGLRQLLLVHSGNAVRGELLRNGIAISILGAPNAGKSSLLNRIVGREAAIVSQEAGTTRDVVEVGLDLGGYFCRLGDTAGLRKAREDTVRGGDDETAIGKIEQEGMRRAKARATESDLVVVMLSLEASSSDEPVSLALDPEVVATAADLIRHKDNVVVAINKADKSLNPDMEGIVQQALTVLPGLTRDRIHLISCKDAAGLESAHDNGGLQAFLQGLIQQFSRLTAALVPDSEVAGVDGADPDPSVWQESLGATERHRLLLEDCTSHLDAFLAEVKSREDGTEGGGSGECGMSVEPDIVVAAEHLRNAAVCLAKITGRGEGGDVEEVLGVVFEKFCVGK